MLFDLKKYAWVDEYLSAKCGSCKDYKDEWNWFRWQVGEKMFAAGCYPGSEHGAYAGMNLLTLKCEPMTADFLREQYSAILPGFYMNKQNWISLNLDEDLPKELVLELCDASYNLVFSKLTKKMQNKINDENRL